MFHHSQQSLRGGSVPFSTGIEKFSKLFSEEKNLLTPNLGTLVIIDFITVSFPNFQIKNNNTEKEDNYKVRFQLLLDNFLVDEVSFEGKIPVSTELERAPIPLQFVFPQVPIFSSQTLKLVVELESLLAGKTGPPPIVNQAVLGIGQYSMQYKIERINASR